MNTAAAPANSMTLRDLPAAERPRNRLRAYGPGSLSNSELIAILLGSGRPGENALNLAQRVLARFQGLHGLSRALDTELEAQPGINAAKASQIIAALELGRRCSSMSPQDRPVIHSAQDAANLLQAEMALLEQEHLKILLLNIKNQVLRIHTLYIGNVRSSMIRPSEVYRSAIRENAPTILAVHNHPSGDPTPSPEDIAVTRDLVQAGNLLQVELLDHLVIGSGGRYVSMKEKKLGFS